ncbi:MAG: response regulator [Anaerolineales bacterium]|nr:response regulator [Anaerolineales bacterium]
MANTLSVLVVDDDRRIANTLVDIIRVNGYDARAAYSAEETLVEIELTEYDCLLVDIKMPGVNGIELMKTISSTHPNLPVILMTAFSSVKVVKAGMQAGAIAALTKPLEMNSLLAFFASLRNEHFIIVFDQQPDVLNTLYKLLLKRGMDVVVSASAEDLSPALMGREKAIALLNLDLHTPGAHETLEIVRTGNSSCPLVLVGETLETIPQDIRWSFDLEFIIGPSLIDSTAQLIEALEELRHRELQKTLMSNN